MRIAIFSDVHGNLSALEAVLADIDRQTVDLVVFAGDLCLFGPRPAECLRLVRAQRIPSVIGNTDGWLVGRGDLPERHREPIAWTNDQLITDDQSWLDRLPFGLRVSPTGNTADDLLIVHANPHNYNDIVFPSEAEQVARWGQVRQSDADLVPLLAGVDAAAIAYGHLHIPGVRVWGGLTLINVSSVSMPGDEDGRAKFAILEWRGKQWSVAHYRVKYDTNAESAAFRASQPPGWEQAAAALDAHGYYYPQRI